MASHTRNPQIVDLRQLSARELDPLLLDEAADWNSELDWDFSKSAGLVRRFADSRMLSGVALVDRGEVAGYGYTGLEGHTGIISDLYVRPGWHHGNTEAKLFRVLFERLTGVPGLRRIESQLMLLDASSVEDLQSGFGMHMFERLLMKLDAHAPLPPGRASTGRRFRIDPWSDNHFDALGAVMSVAHVGHVDSQINEHYRTAQAASRFLRNIVRFPGCATFCYPASYVAFDLNTGLIAGMLLTSFVAAEVGHITELCVAPTARSAGLGYAMLRKSLATLGSAGAKRISVTVTAANKDAIGLYTRCGFREARRFCAYVWQDGSERLRRVLEDGRFPAYVIGDQYGGGEIRLLVAVGVPFGSGDASP